MGYWDDQQSGWLRTAQLECEVYGHVVSDDLRDKYREHFRLYDGERVNLHDWTTYTHLPARYRSNHAIPNQYAELYPPSFSQNRQGISGKLSA